MVQLLVAEGTFPAIQHRLSLLTMRREGQHDLVRRRLPDPVPVGSTLLPNLWQSTLCAAAGTALLAFAGKSRPGLFLHAAAWTGVVGLEFTALDSYGRREINRAIFKMDNVEPKPGKLWQRTKHFSFDDAVIAGGVVGALLALSPHAFPGAHGWKRFFGAATVGSALGGYVGQRHNSESAQIQGLVEMADTMVSVRHYARLREDEKVQASLSRIGKIAFTLYSIPSSIIKTGSASAAGGAGAPVTGQPMQKQHHGGSASNPSAVLQYVFNKGEPAGPDMEDGVRAYKDSLADRDAGALKDWLERLQEVRKASADEASYLWQYLAQKEHHFYSLVKEDHEKDVIRRKLQLLNSMTFDFATRDAIIEYQVADIMKRLRQMERTNPTNLSSNRDLLLALSRALQTEQPVDWKDRYDPQLSIEVVRVVWTQQKEILAKLEQSMAMHRESLVESGYLEETGLKTLQQHTEVMKTNFEATERLSKELEDQVRRADGQVKS